MFDGSRDGCCVPHQSEIVELGPCLVIRTILRSGDLGSGEEELFRELKVVQDHT